MYICHSHFFHPCLCISQVSLLIGGPWVLYYTSSWSDVHLSSGIQPRNCFHKSLMVSLCCQCKHTADCRNDWWLLRTDLKENTRISLIVRMWFPTLDLGFWSWTYRNCWFVILIEFLVQRLFMICNWLTCSCQIYHVWVEVIWDGGGGLAIP